MSHLIFPLAFALNWCNELIPEMPKIKRVMVANITNGNSVDWFIPTVRFFKWRIWKVMGWFLLSYRPLDRRDLALLAVKTIFALYPCLHLSQILLTWQISDLVILPSLHLTFYPTNTRQNIHWNQGTFCYLESAFSNREPFFWKILDQR